MLPPIDNLHNAQALMLDRVQAQAIIGKHLSNRLYYRTLVIQKQDHVDKEHSILICIDIPTSELSKTRATGYLRSSISLLGVILECKEQIGGSSTAHYEAQLTYLPEGYGNVYEYAAALSNEFFNTYVK